MAILSTIGQWILSWLLQKLWNLGDAALKDHLAKERTASHIKDVMGRYESVIKDAEEKAKDGLTEDEINEIRKKKIALEEELINGGGS